MDHPERRRLLLATILTLVALPALWLMSRDDDSGAPNVATAGIAVAAGDDATGTSASTADGALGAAAPVFLEGPAVRPSGIAEIAVPAAPRAEIRSSSATYRSTLTPGSCLVPFVSTGTTLTIVNLDTNRSTTCVAIYSPASEVDDVVLHTGTFLDIADLTDAPIPVEFHP